MLRTNKPRKTTMSPSSCLLFALVISVCDIKLSSANDWLWRTEADSGIERHVTMQVNPGCKVEACKNLTVVYVMAKGPEDILHHLWSFEGVPTFHYAKTSTDAELTINWDMFLNGTRNGSFVFSKKPDYFSATCLTKLIEFNDVNDTGILPNDPDFKELTTFNPEYLEWELLPGLSVESNSSATAVFHAKAFNGTGIEPTTNFQITLSAFGKHGRSESLPHLMHTENSTRVDFVFDHVETVHSYVNARLAVELVSVVTENATGVFRLEETKSLDDEYTPGVFKLVQLFSPSRQHFFQWRPIAYTSAIRDISDSTGLGHDHLRPLRPAELNLNNSLVNWIEADFDVTRLANVALNITFGSQGDGFYKGSNYTAWTFVMGYGRPAGDQLSGMLLLVVAVGLGLPAFLILSGGVWVCVRQLKRRQDDLLLSS